MAKKMTAPHTSKALNGSDGSMSFLKGVEGLQEEDVKESPMGEDENNDLENREYDKAEVDLNNLISGKEVKAKASEKLPVRRYKKAKGVDG
jgi:hypothetical protein